LSTDVAVHRSPIRQTVSAMAATTAAEPQVPGSGPKPFVSKWSARYRGATVEDLEPPAALSLTPKDPISTALMAAFERDYTHLTIVDGTTRALLGYVSIPQLQAQLSAGRVTADDPISRAMSRFQRRGRSYTVITMQTPLEELEEFFESGPDTGDEKRDFAVVTDAGRRFVLGVATKADLEEFAKRRLE
jgi:CBS domain-containing protein